MDTGFTTTLDHGDLRTVHFDTEAFSCCCSKSCLKTDLATGHGLTGVAEYSSLSHQEEGWKAGCAPSLGGKGGVVVHDLCNSSRL